MPAEDKRVYQEIARVFGFLNELGACAQERSISITTEQYVSSMYLESPSHESSPPESLSIVRTCSASRLRGCGVGTR